MASADIKKLHGAEAYKVLGHDARWDNREEVDYTNTNINPELADKNEVLRFKGMERETAKQSYERLKKRVEELDAIHPPRRRKKDRVTMIAFEIPAPANLPAEREREFFAIAYREFARMCGGTEQVSQLYIHRDEIHDYIDPVTKETRTSRVHAHAVGIPYTPAHGVNCKNFCTRERFKELQQRIHSRCREELGIEFLDGSGRHSRASVEQLKTASLHALKQQEQEAIKRNQRALERVQGLQKEYDNLRVELNNKERDKRKLEEEIHSLESRSKELSEAISQEMTDCNFLNQYHITKNLLEEYQNYFDIKKSYELDNDLAERAVDSEFLKAGPSERLKEANERLTSLAPAPWELVDVVEDIYKPKKHDLDLDR